MKLKRFETFEIPIAAGDGASEFAIQDQPDIRDDGKQDIIITGLETYPAEIVPLTPNGNTMATLAQLQNSFLTLYIDGEESVYQIPMVRLLPVFTRAATGLANYDEICLENLRVVWNKSKIQLGTPFVGAAAFSYLIGVRYKKLPAGSWQSLLDSAGYPEGW